MVAFSAFNLKKNINVNVSEKYKIVRNFLDQKSIDNH